MEALKPCGRKEVVWWCPASLPTPRPLLTPPTLPRGWLPEERIGAAEPEAVKEGAEALKVLPAREEGRYVLDTGRDAVGGA